MCILATTAEVDTKNGTAPFVSVIPHSPLTEPVEPMKIREAAISEKLQIGEIASLRACSLETLLYG